MQHDRGFQWEWLGADVAYEEGMRRMRDAMVQVEQDNSRTILLLQEHCPVITTTRSAKLAQNLLSTPQQIENSGIELIQSDRGGDITFHGPGQIVGYPIMTLKPVNTKRSEKPYYDLVAYVRWLESKVIAALSSFELKGLHSKAGYTGVWISDLKNAAQWEHDIHARKLVQIGVGVTRSGVTRHGFAINHTIELERYFSHIIPCGLSRRPVTTLEREGIKISRQRLIDALAQEFG